MVAQEESPERVRLSIEVGAVFDPAHTASGRLLLAHQPPGARTRGAAPDWESSLAAIRRTGVSTAESETINGVRDVAVLVGGPGAGLMAALAVTRRLRRGERVDDDALVAGMREAARVITEALGIGGARPE